MMITEQDIDRVQGGVEQEIAWSYVERLEQDNRDLKAVIRELEMELAQLERMMSEDLND
jgi:hypothetical protein